ncbi:MAG: low molecular weight phosphotyrosine protein phosphatase [Proteobacteria bacterium]|nr:low molecular weight phosphotyrosine protein phosphatase [Pseudomonadota bacterium]
MGDAVLPYGVLFVCTGNICRSPTAEGAFRRHVREAGLEKRFRIDSAGTTGYHAGDPPDSRSLSVALECGVAMDDLRARRLEQSDFHEFDLILAMDGGHMAEMRRMAGAESRARLSMFLDFLPDAGRADVPDPYYGGRKDFLYVFELADRGARALLSHLRGEMGI